MSQDHQTPGTPHHGHHSNPNFVSPPPVQIDMSNVIPGDTTVPVSTIPSIANPVVNTEISQQIESTPAVTEVTPSPVVESVPVVFPEHVTETTTSTMDTNQEPNLTNSVTFTPIRSNIRNAIQEWDVSIPLTDKDKNEDSILALPSDTQENTHRLLSSLPNIDIDSTESGYNWMSIIRASRFSTPYYSADSGLREDEPNVRPDYSNHADAWFTRTVNREDAKWRQTVESEKGKLNAASPSFNDKGAVNLTGEAAVLRVRNLVGLGSIIQIPLWHSGFWITFKAPSDGDFLELSRRLSEDKITLGRQTYGLAFANTSSIFAAQIMNFALSYVYDTSLQTNITHAEMRSMISELDIPIIAWGLACVIWPKGFLYARAVLDQEKEPNAVIRERLNLKKLLWTDTNALTKWQIGHMANTIGNSMSKDSITRYKDEFTRGKGRTVQLSEGLSMTLRVPTMDQYLTSGAKWINSIEAMVTQAFGPGQDIAARDQYIIDQGKATNMRQFAHYVDYITAGNGIIKDEETIESVFNSLTSSDDIRDAYFKGIREFTEDATISIIGIPVSDEKEKGDLPRFPHLLALDTLSVFFTLLVQKTQQISNRD